MNPANLFLEKLKSDQVFFELYSMLKSPFERREFLKAKNLLFSKLDLEKAMNNLSDWELSMVEDTSSFRSDKRVAGLEMCCCCKVGGGGNDTTDVKHK